MFAFWASSLTSFPMEDCLFSHGSDSLSKHERPSEMRCIYQHLLPACTYCTGWFQEERNHQRPLSHLWAPCENSVALAYPRLTWAAWWHEAVMGGIVWTLGGGVNSVTLVKLVFQLFFCSRTRCWSLVVPWWDVGSLERIESANITPCTWVLQTTWAWTCTLVPGRYKLVKIRLPFKLLWFKPRLSLDLNMQSHWSRKSITSDWNLSMFSSNIFFFTVRSGLYFS